MGFLLTAIASAILCASGVLSAYTALILAVGSFIWMCLGTGLYFKFGFFKFYYHDLLGWHTPDDSPQYSDGCSQHARCKHCGKDIMQDSQGNWF